MAIKTRSKLLLRIAAVFMLLHTAGHTMGALTWKEAPNEAVGKVISGMQAEPFDFMGRSVTLASFFDGYGMIMIPVLLLTSALLWLISGESGNRLAVGIATLLTVFLLLMAVLEYIYFFPFAATITLLAGICALFARVGMGTTDR